MTSIAMTRQRLLQSLDAEGGLHGDRHAMRQDPAGSDVDHRRKVDEAAPHRNIAYVRRPDVVRPLDLSTFTPRSR